ncbi:hypothetical protein QR680_015042 [Steinernema hermaphroditum]|uniref:Uncharacterized protein n=1 Tax=Steinernema hermaphroditum TaxID=289476 RepID=A0AA39M596_9BILA|nr:hypothetical protein QR680_015042 [Steinernema hermaphroditum]
MYEDLPVQFGLSVTWKKFTKTSPRGIYVNGDIRKPYEFDTIYFRQLGCPSRENKYWHQLCSEKFAAIRAVLKESRGVHVEFNCAFPKHHDLISTVLNSIRKLHIIRYDEHYYDTGRAITSKELMLNRKFLDVLLQATWMPNFTTLCLEPNTNGNLSYEEAFNQLLYSCVTSGQLKRYKICDEYEWKHCKDLRKLEIVSARDESEEDHWSDYDICLSCIAD